MAALLLAALLGSCIFGAGGLLHLGLLHTERVALAEEVFRLLSKNDDLRQRILRLRRSDRVIERLARRELGLVRDDEIVYRSHPRTDEPSPLAHQTAGN